MFDTQTDVERKILAILKVLNSLQRPAGSRIIANRLIDYGIVLTERAVRYHLRITDERGLTRLVRERDGRVITERGINEIRRALVEDKVGLAISRIELLAFRTNFDFESRRGTVPLNISIFREESFPVALDAMSAAFEKGLCVSNMVYVAHEGQHIGDMIVPPGKVALATVCSIVINGALLKAGIPMDSRFGGVLQLENDRPARFIELIHYNGSSLDPSEVFIKAGMTSVSTAALTGTGEILANFREIPAICRNTAERVITQLERANLHGVLLMGETSEPVCEIPVDLNRVGVVLVGGLNPAACAKEAGIEAENISMSGVIDYEQLINYREVLSAVA